MNPRALLLLLIFVAAAFCTARAEPALAPATIVVFNSNDRESAELAKFYAEKRGIARDHVVGLACSRDEEISREEYDRAIAAPLREMFRERKWWTLRESAEGPTGVSRNTIRFVALIRGMPLKIRPAEAYPGDKPGSGPVGNRNDASVDSELAILARFSGEISGAVTNPIFQSYRPIVEAADSPVMLVSRLDAPSAQTVRRMINDAIEAEKNGLWGRAFVDHAQNTGGLEVGDRWLRETIGQLHKVGVPVVSDDAPSTLPDGYPVSDCALYYGWYSDRIAGPFAQPSFRFSAGAVAVHIHSYSASTLRDPAANWVAPLLTQGAAASLGNVYEPYLQLTTNVSIMNDRLLHGFTFAESAYMATPAVSWMQVMVGDPLYRPFASWLQIDAKAAPAKGAVPPWKMYHEFAVQNAARPPAEYRTLGRQAASRAKNGPMIEDLGLMEARDGKWPSATAHFQQARSLYTKREDILRNVLHEANSWAKQGKPRRALEVVRSVLRIVSDAPTLALFKKVEQELAPPAPTQPQVQPQRPR